MVKRSSILVLVLGLLLVVGAMAPVAAGATRPISGKMTWKGDPVVGVGIMLIDTAVGDVRYTCTDADGKYRFPNATVGNRHLFIVANLDGIGTSPVGTAPCTNLAFESPGKLDWLNYRHPGLHGVWGATSGFDLPAGQGAFKIPVRLRVATHVCNGYKATVKGTAGPDLLTGTAGRDVLVGKGGDDVLNGKGGRDLLCGDAGKDTINGQGGGDFAYGGPGNDLIRGNSARDLLHGGSGNDRIFGGGGNDTLHGEDGKKDKLTGGAGVDSCVDSDAAKLDCENVSP